MSRLESIVRASDKQRLGRLVGLVMEKTVMRYIVSGGLAFAIELAFTLTFHEVLGLSAGLSVGSAFWIGLVTSFLLQKLLTFRDYQRTTQTISRQIGLYGVLVIVNYLFTLAVVMALPDDILVVSRSFAIGITTAWNYVVYKFIFKIENSTEQSKQEN